MPVNNSSGEAGNDRTILIVERTSDGSANLGTVLADLGYRTRRESDHHTALDVLARGETIDLVIAAERNADDEGMEFLTAMHQHFPDLPTIVMSDDSSVERYLKAVNLGVFEYLVRPVHMQELHQIIRSAFGDSPKNGPSAEQARTSVS